MSKFNPDKNTIGYHLLEEAKKKIKKLESEIERLKAERDEARRMFCLSEMKSTRKWYRFRRTAGSIARKQGWDCFKEQGE